MTNNIIAPGGTICILGAGQLGKMTLQAAHQLGYHTMVWAPEGDIPAMEMATHRLVRPYTCKTTFDEVLRNADVITTEWENIPLELIQKLERRGGIVRPGSKVLKAAQSRWAEKQLARHLGIPATKTAHIRADAVNYVGWQDYLPGILKTDALGYDGKGQWLVTTIKELTSALTEARKDKPVDCVLEKLVPLQTELSVLVARTTDGLMAVSDVVENEHKNGILNTTKWPPYDDARTPSKITLVQEYAPRIADYLGLEGILALEFFVDRSNGYVLFNEMAPRPHNSFHGSIEAAWTSQFEQHVRSICNLPLGDLTFHTPFKMMNLIGGSWEKDWSKHFADNEGPGSLHLYGKAESRPGRKMGHVTVLCPR